MSKKKKKRNDDFDTTWTGLCCVCGEPVTDDNDVYICEGDHVHCHCMEDGGDK